MEIFFWVITTVYWVIFFPLFVLSHWKASQAGEARILKRVDESRYYGLFIWAYCKFFIVGTALIGGLIFFSE